MWTRLGRQRRHAAAARCSTTPRPATTGSTYPERLEQAGDLVEDLPGRRRRARRRRTPGVGPTTPTSATTATTRCCTSTSTRTRAGQPAVREGAHRDQHHDRRRRSSTSSAPTCAAARCRRSRGSSAPEAYTEHPQLARELRRLVRLAGARRADRESGGLEQDRLFLTYDENDGFFDHMVPPTPPQSPRAGPVHRRHHERDLPRRRGNTRGPYGLGMRVPMLVISPWSKGGWVSSRGLRPHLADPLHRAALRAPAPDWSRPTSRPGGAPWRAISPRPSTSSSPSAGVVPLPSTASYAPPTTTATPTTCRARRRRKRCRGKSPACDQRARCPTTSPSQARSTRATAT